MFFNLVNFFLILITLSGCAYSYIDSKGDKHITGLVNMKIEPSDKKDRQYGETVQITSFGVSIYSTPINRGFSVGYNQETLTELPENGCFQLKPSNPVQTQ